MSRIGTVALMFMIFTSIHAGCGDSGTSTESSSRKGGGSDTASDQPTVVKSNDTESVVDIDPGVLGYTATFPKDQAMALLDALESPETDVSLAVTSIANRAVKAWQVKILVSVIIADVKLFRDKLAKKMGPNGVVVNVWGVRTNAAFMSPVATANFKDWLAEKLLPEDLAKKAQNDWTKRMPDKWRRAMANHDARNTIPVYWTINPLD